MYAVICMSRGGLSANEKEEKIASNDNGCCLSVVERKCYRDMFMACVYNDNVLQVLRAIRLNSVTQSVYFGFLSNGV